LELLHRYPTAPLLAAAAPAELQAIPYLPHPHIDALLQHARTSIASLTDATVAELVRDQVRQLRDGTARQKRLENLLIAASQALPQKNHPATTPVIASVPAAVLTASILDSGQPPVRRRWASAQASTRATVNGGRAAPRGTDGRVPVKRARVSPAGKPR